MAPAEHKPWATCLHPQPRKAKDRNSKKRRENKEQANGLQPRPKERNGKELKEARREHRKGERNKDPAPRTRKNEIKETKREQRKGERIATAPVLIATTRLGKSRQVTEATIPAIQLRST